MAGEMITSLKALLSPQMAKYVGSSCSQQLRGTGARGKQGARGGSLALAPRPLALLSALGGFGDPCLAGPAGLCPWAPRSPPAPVTSLPNGAREADLGLQS